MMKNISWRMYNKYIVPTGLCHRVLAICYKYFVPDGTKYNELQIHSGMDEIFSIQ